MRKALCLIAFLLPAACTTAPVRPSGVYVPVTPPKGTVSPSNVHLPVTPPSAPVEQLEADLASPEPARRALAAWQLAGAVTISDAARARLLALVLDDSDEKVKLAATWALAHVGSTDAGGAKTTSSAESAIPYDSPPRILVQTKPTYPQQAVERHAQGVVVLDILLDERGEIAHVEVRESIPPLSEAALLCVRGWSFAPATRQGRPVPALVRASVVFRLF